MNEKIVKLQSLNPNFKIYDINSNEFKNYGRILNLKCSSSLIKKLENETNIPNEGNIYRAYVRDWEEKEIVEELKKYYDGAIEIGYCNGQNTKLNALEWHDCNEINIFSTDAILFLAKLDNLNNFKLDSNKIKAFFVEKGTSILMNSDTLHFAPCKVDKNGFKAIIILSDLTNTELDVKPIDYKEDSENKMKALLFKKNKFIICHEEATNLTNQGVQANINGENYNLKI